MGFWAAPLDLQRSKNSLNSAKAFTLTLWGQKMKLNQQAFPVLAASLKLERKRQGMSREQAAAVSGVSPSFIRDAETTPQNCTLDRLVRLTNGLGLTLSLTSWQEPPTP